ncbi:Corticotropin-releasing factor receptor 1 [Amphibalanus amphitrite]|uniref:Corticotropin-releasing factor receptor 1 n=1 Tax=Amphibalanus amphitrite TaxID=1232801 RepID=A0A6A4X8L6_AMPAM|nr:Corticotropin-releasing factor receptor 1 [Amphibalanus amphitrite]
MATSDQSPCEQNTVDGDLNNSTTYCEAVVDNLGRCWPRTPANERRTVLCSDVIRQEMVNIGAPHLPEINISSDAVAFRECDATGHWKGGGNWTNYTLCMGPLDELEQVDDGGSRALLTYITFFGSLASLVFLSVALFIFCYFRCLQCSRLSVHKNLIVALMLCNILMIIMTEPFITGRGGGTYRDVEWLCKVIVSLQMYGRISAIMWMWNEGFFLHSRITVSIFDSRAPFKFLHLVGWGLSAVFVIAWALMTAPSDVICLLSAGLSAVFVIAWALVTERALPHNCWNGYAQLPEVWLLIAPMITALGINMLFLFNVVRILVTRMRNNTTMEMEKIRKAIKATAILFPLLGITNLFFFIRPSDNRDSKYQVYLITNSILHSLQGIFVAILYCFLNSEVRVAIRKKYYRIMVTHNSSRWSRKNSCRTSTLFVSQADRLCCRPQKWTTSCRGGAAAPTEVKAAGQQTNWSRRAPPQGETEI